jgi:hypothetical protein
MPEFIDKWLTWWGTPLGETLTVILLSMWVIDLAIINTAAYRAAIQEKTLATLNELVDMAKEQRSRELRRENPAEYEANLTRRSALNDRRNVLQKTLEELRARQDKGWLRTPEYRSALEEVVKLYAEIDKLNKLL